MDIVKRVSISMVVAVAAIEVSYLLLDMSYVFSLGLRPLIPSLLCDTVLVFILKYILDNYCRVRDAVGAAKLSASLTALIMCSSAPLQIQYLTGVFYALTFAVNIFASFTAAILAMTYIKK